MIILLNNLSKYEDLFLVFIWREFSLRYRQSVFGILWALVQPLSMMLLFTFVFTFIMPVAVSNYPYPLFFYSAILPWTFFSSSLNYAIPSLVSHYNLITKIYFPKENPAPCRHSSCVDRSPHRTGYFCFHAAFL